MNDEVDRDAANKKLFKELFDRKFTPSHWAMCAENLWQAAEVLFSSYKSSTAEDGEPIHPENTELDIPASLLYGYAMENAIKGLLIKKHNLDASKISSFEKWMHHDLVSLFADAKILVSENQERILKTLTEHILWAGKYPVSKDFNNFIVPNQFEHNSLPPVRNFPPSSINISMQQELKKLFGVLLEEIRRDLLPKRKPSR